MYIALLEQVHQFLGMEQLSLKSQFLTKSKSIKKIASQAISSSPSKPSSQLDSPSSPAKPSSPSSPPGSEDATAWRVSQIHEVAFKICEEIQNSLAPYQLHRWMKTQTASEEGAAKIARLFSMAASLAPLIPDTADIGAYSKSLEAQTYKRIVQQMPRLIVAAAFGERLVADNMRFGPRRRQCLQQ